MRSEINRRREEWAVPKAASLAKNQETQVFYVDYATGMEDFSVFVLFLSEQNYNSLARVELALLERCTYSKGK